ncbi:hypothetical protein HYE05_03860 [Mycoplasmopsis bovis]|nr:hypothetical protein [Mycoplasmopsis bovis]QQH27663.1 hypothetical protein HYE05_03860 [Mycoplasmopsis bovis]
MSAVLILFCLSLAPCTIDLVVPELASVPWFLCSELASVPWTFLPELALYLDLFDAWVSFVP